MRADRPKCDDGVMSDSPSSEKHNRRALVLKAGLLAVFILASFGVCFFARDLNFVMMGWPLHFWMAAQGSVLVFMVVLVVYAHVMNRLEDEEEMVEKGTSADE
jgi:putative solute:sodium symporter small subunit